MLFRIAIVSALLATAFEASGQVPTTRPPVGTVYFKDAMDCYDMADHNGTPVCAMSSSGREFDASAPFRKMTSMQLPYGRYVLTAKILEYTYGRPLNPWAAVECQLVDDLTGRIIDYSSENFGSHAYWETAGDSGVRAILVGDDGGMPLVLNGVLDVTRTSGTTVSIACRVQGQSMGQAADGTLYWGAPLREIRFHGGQIMAVSAASIIRR